MKGFVGILSGIGILVLTVAAFGASFQDLTTATAHCGASLIGNASEGSGNYTCWEVPITIGKTFVVPDRNINYGVQSILATRELSEDGLQERLNASGELTPEQMQYFQAFQKTDEWALRMRIFLGILAFMLLLVFLVYIGCTIAFSADYDLGTFLVIVFAALLLLAIASFIFDDSPEPGPFSIPGFHTPFKGLRALIGNPGVLIDVVDDTGMMPGTTNIRGDVLTDDEIDALDS